MVGIVISYDNSIVFFNGNSSQALNYN